MKFTHILMRLKDGDWTTIHKNNIDKYKAEGYEFGSESRGASSSHKAEAIKYGKYGKSLIFDGRYKGHIAMKELTKGDTVAVEEKDVKRYQEAGMKLVDGKVLENK